ncbi:NAD(P)-dependent glycerol-3-phosphate dehydrogenase [bacterium]|nr:NAD(P)-dependent glycerol-3-phosphate dehydrogenase [bacterium]
MKITVLGAGNWGTTAALLLDKNGHTVSLWEYNEQLARDMIEHRENETYLRGFPIPDTILATWRLGEAVEGADMLVFAVPSSVMRQTAKAVKNAGNLSENVLMASLSKGLEHDTMMTMTGIIAEETGVEKTVALSGPCIANEVARGLPTTIVSASDVPEAALTVRDAFMTPRFRVYTSDDPHGVQLGGALKNIIAIAAGINDGLGYGTNAKSALVTRGIVEIIRFGKMQGACPETFNGLSGIGDLITTCISGHSRNRRLGEELARGRKTEDILREMVMVAEGVPTTRSVHEYAVKHDIDMPITTKVYGVLFEGLPPGEAVRELMTRDPKHEHIV